MWNVTSSIPRGSFICVRSPISGSPIVPVPMTCTIALSAMTALLVKVAGDYDIGLRERCQARRGCEAARLLESDRRYVARDPELPPMGDHEKSTIPSMTVGELLTDDAAASLNLDARLGRRWDSTTLVDRARDPEARARAGGVSRAHPSRTRPGARHSPRSSFLAERAPAERSRIVSQLCRQG